MKGYNVRADGSESFAIRSAPTARYKPCNKVTRVAYNLCFLAAGFRLAFDAGWGTGIAKTWASLSSDMGAKACADIPGADGRIG